MISPHLLLFHQSPVPPFGLHILLNSTFHLVCNLSIGLLLFFILFSTIRDILIVSILIKLSKHCKCFLLIAYFSNSSIHRREPSVLRPAAIRHQVAFHSCRHEVQSQCCVISYNLLLGESACSCFAQPINSLISVEHSIKLRVLCVFTRNKSD